MERSRHVVRGVIVVALVLAACQTREDSARKTGREAALLAERACGSDAGNDEICRGSMCSDRCARFADSTGLTETCTSRCMGQGTCDSDADCDRGLVCVMIAPRLRRCEAPRDAE